MDRKADGGAMEPLLERDSSSGGVPASSSLRRTMSEQLEDLEAAQKAQLEDTRANIKGLVLAAMVYRSVGVIFGDLGTSPMYIFPSTFDHPPSRADAMGALSLIFWTLTLLALLKYVLIVLWANDDGEGGTISLYSLLCQEAKIGFEYRTHRNDQLLTRLSRTTGLARPSKSAVTSRSRFKEVLERSSLLKRVLFITVICGTSAVIADGILTPGVSVLSAVEGLRVAVPSMPQEVVIIITVAILVAMFSAQRYGTDAVGAAFAPILIVWLLAIAGVGLYNAVRHDPGVFAAINPYHAVQFFVRNGFDGWRMLGGILLCVTGTEAMFADLGHFNVPAIQISFSCVAFPCLVLQYMGQTAYLIHNPERYADAFWSAVPVPIFWPMFFVGTLAAIVASQALITGVFSITNQLMSLNCLPPLKVVHTSTSHHGQIFVPEVNYFLMTLTIAVVLGFQDSTSLSSAYGVAVTMDMLTTTGLVFLVMVMVWRLHVALAALFLVFFLTIELAFFTSTLLKVPHGGWFPLVIAGLLTTLMYVWNWGQRLKSVSNANRHVKAEHFFAEGEENLRLLWSDSPIVRVPGVAFFFSGPKPGLPPVLQHFVKNVPALHDVLVLVNVRHVPVSTVLPEERVLVSAIPGFSGLYRAVVRFGYNDLSDLGEGFAQEVNASILLQHLQQAEAAAEEGRQGSSTLETLQEDGREAGREAGREGGVRFFEATEPRQATRDWDAGLDFPQHSPTLDFARHGSMPATPLVQDVVLANLQRRSLSEIHPQASKPISVLGVLGRQSASAASRERRNSLGRDTRNSLTRRSVPAVLPTKSSWVKSFNEPYRRHDWHSPEEPLLGVVTDSGGGDNAEGSPTTPNGQAQPSVFKPRRDTQEDRLAARIQHARMQGVVYVTGRSNITSRENSSWLRKLALEGLYAVMHHNSQEWAMAQKIPQDRLIEVGMTVTI